MPRGWSGALIGHGPYPVGHSVRAAGTFETKGPDERSPVERELLDAVLDEDNRTLADMADDAYASPFHLTRVLTRDAIQQVWREVLGLLATGQQPKQIARSLGISLHTCRGYIKNILRALDAHSALEAVVEAHRRGLIQLPTVR